MTYSREDSVAKSGAGNEGAAYAQALLDSERKTLEELKLRNAHELEKLKLNRGWFGQFIGNWDNLPKFAALIFMVMGYTFAAVAVFLNEYTFAERMVAAATAALAYLFGRGSK